MRGGPSCITRKHNGSWLVRPGAYRGRERGEASLVAKKGRGRKQQVAWPTEMNGGEFHVIPWYPFYAIEWKKWNNNYYWALTLIYRELEYSRGTRAEEEGRRGWRMSVYREFLQHMFRIIWINKYTQAKDYNPWIYERVYIMYSRYYYCCCCLLLFFNFFFIFISCCSPLYHKHHHNIVSASN